MGKDSCKINSECYIEAKGIDTEKFTVPVVLSDETPMEQYSYEYGKFTLILEHSENSIDLARDGIMSIFWGHNDYSLPLGAYEDVRLEDGKLKATAVFDEDDEFSMKVFGKIKKGIVKSLSIGADILEKTITKDDKNNVIITATKWRPFEGSFVGVPANENAMVSLSKPKQGNDMKIEDALAFAKSANAEDKAQLSKALGLGNGADIESLKVKLTKANSEKEQIVELSKATIVEVVSMMNDEKYDAVSAEDKKEALSKIVLNKDGSANMDKVEIALLTKVALSKVPTVGQDIEKDVEDEKDIQDMGGKF